MTVWYLEDNHQCYKHDCELYSPAYRGRGGEVHNREEGEIARTSKGEEDIG